MVNRPDLVGRINPPLTGAQRAQMIRFYLTHLPLDSPETETVWYTLLDLRPGFVNNLLTKDRQTKGEKHFCEHTVAETPLMMLGAIEKMIKERIKELDGKFKFVDFGSGMGDPSFFIGGKYPNSSVVGYEINKIKVRETSKVATNLEYNNINFFEQDLSQAAFVPIVSDFYYFWNPVYPEILKGVVAKLKKIYDEGNDFIVITNKHVRPGSEWTTAEFVKQGSWITEDTEMAAKVGVTFMDLPPLDSWMPAIWKTKPRKRKTENEPADKPAEL
jgi:hypothetical protein